MTTTTASVGTEADVGLEQAWTTGNASASDNSYSSAALSANLETNILKCTNFGFAIDAGDTIEGVEVLIEWHDGEGTSTMVDKLVQLYKAGTLSGDDKATGAVTLGTADTTDTYGGVADLWSNTLAPSDVNNSGFGVGISVEVPSSPAGTANIDHVQIRITHSGAATTLTKALSGLSGLSGTICP